VQVAGSKPVPEVGFELQEANFPRIPYRICPKLATPESITHEKMESP